MILVNISSNAFESNQFEYDDSDTVQKIKTDLMNDLELTNDEDEVINNSELLFSFFLQLESEKQILDDKLETSLSDLGSNEINIFVDIDYKESELYNDYEEDDSSDTQTTAQTIAVAAATTAAIAAAAPVAAPIALASAVAPSIISNISSYGSWLVGSAINGVVGSAIGGVGIVGGNGGVGNRGVAKSFARSAAKSAAPAAAAPAAAAPVAASLACSASVAAPRSLYAGFGSRRRVRPNGFHATFKNDLKTRHCN